jgi:hypothetical protein
MAAGLLAAGVTAASAGQGPIELSKATSAAGASQASDVPLIQLGGGLIIGVPVGDFGQNVEVAAGLAGQFDVGLGQSIFSVGLEGGYQWYGTESRRAPLSPTIPDIIVKITTENDLWTLHGRFRAQRREGRLRPYVDGLAGLTNLRTTTFLENCDDCDNLGSTNLSDFVFSYGGGGGLTIGFGPPPDVFRLDLSLRFLAGGEADYLTEGGIRNEAGVVVLDVRRSRTDMLLVYVGVAIGR